MTKRVLSDEQLEALVNASDSEDTISEDENHTSDDNIHPSSESEDISDADISNDNVHAVQFIQSKDKKITWSLQPFPQTGRASSANIINVTPGPTRYAIARVSDIKSSFLVMMNDNIQSIVVEMTNIEGQRVYGDGWEALDKITLQAYIGLLLLAGVYKSYGESTKSLWDPETGRAIFPAVMSLKRFCCISRVLRFDDKSDRRARRVNDKLAPIRVLWDKWVEMLSKLYNPGTNVTVDEQLVAFRGRCPFKQYIPSKPSKYGVKIWTLCDSATSYVLKTQIYTGKLPGQSPEKNQGMRVVMDLTYELKGQNVTCDNFFTSYALGQGLLKRHLTMLGTVRKNKPELPNNISSKEDVHTSKFFFTKDTTIVSYVPRKNKQVVLMSTMHNSVEISNREDKKPKMILDYNASKGAVDTLDQLIGTYTCKRKTNRWPMIIFYNIIDTSAYNAFVLWREINPGWKKNVLYKRRIFLDELGRLLVSPYIVARKMQPRNEQSAAIVRKIQTGNPSTPSFIGGNRNCKRSRCKFCPSSCDNKTPMKCSNCNKHVCKTHVRYLCPNCEK